MRKDKGVIIADRNTRREERDEDDDESNPVDVPTPAVKISIPKASSKYDFVKVKVWLGDNADHYYVLSRFLLSRMLTVTKIPNHVAIKIALELKKLLIDNSLLDVSQSDLEANLFKGENQEKKKVVCSLYEVLRTNGICTNLKGYCTDLVTFIFHHQRVPLVILVCGTACVGKSTIATQLAQRLNLPNVLQTDMVYELLRTATDAPLASSPVWARDFRSSEELITEFCRECRVVRKGLAGDLKKAMKDGKPIIIEGIHLDPSIYLMDDENKLPTDISEKVEEPNSLTSDDKNVLETESNPSTDGGNHSENRDGAPQNATPVERIHADLLNKVSDHLESIDIAANDSVDKGETTKDPEAGGNPPAKKEKSGSEPIIIPIVLKMADFDHEALLDEWISTRTFSDKCLIQDKDKLISNLKTIQNYLCSFKSQGLTVVNISATTFPQTLDWLHSHLLQCIEQGITSDSSGRGRQPAEN
ncbi:hypothetical protein RHGRI_027761 [Rhododendron griersonianum]|uniref:2-phosphoglycerate kinase n=1 Tax=Rhododendron griersonianum TaxID=479676 RepID=A0AAV6J2C5_9ERIC|nr:hypothetical protein RHGRI_027761 [Rhododendron griersonianum]